MFSILKRYDASYTGKRIELNSNIFIKSSNNYLSLFSFLPIFRIARCDNLQGLRFQTNNVGLTPPGDISEENLVDIEQ